MDKRSSKKRPRHEGDEGVGSLLRLQELVDRENIFGRKIALAIANGYFFQKYEDGGRYVYGPRVHDPRCPCAETEQLILKEVQLHP